MITTRFTRVPPTAQTETLPLGWVAISHRYVDDVKQRREMYGEWYRLKSKEGTIYRVLRFSPRLKGTANAEEGQLLIDYNGWLELTGHSPKRNESVEIEITKAKRWQYMQLSLSHPDPTYRHNSVLALIGVGLGVLSLVISFL